MTEVNMLIVDDEHDMRTGLQRVMGRKLPDVNVTICGNALDALNALQDRSFSLALLDIKMEGMDGLDLLAELRMCDPWMTIIMMTGYGTIETAVKAIRAGAYDFISKPFDNETLLRVVQKGLERNQLIRENLYLREKVKKHFLSGKITKIILDHFGVLFQTRARGKRETLRNLVSNIWSARFRVYRSQFL